MGQWQKADKWQNEPVFRMLGNERVRNNCNGVDVASHSKPRSRERSAFCGFHPVVSVETGSSEIVELREVR